MGKIKYKQNLTLDILKSECSKRDISEEFILNFFGESVMKLLLIDMSKVRYNFENKNIIWATDNYIQYKDLLENADAYDPKSPITIKCITINGLIIQPRIDKEKSNQQARTKDKAEVFTPSWVCNKQNKLIDDDWFGVENMFNVPVGDKGWKATENKINFSKTKKTWEDYVRAKRLEITCGEAPYLVSRYDTVTGEQIPIKERIGLLDRKLRVVSENTNEEKDWVNWAIKAFWSTYGYEYQGDNLLLARENILFTFIDYYIDKFNKIPNLQYIKTIANIIAWNIWQMDGLTFMPPFEKERIDNNKFLEKQFLKKNKELTTPFDTEPKYCYIKDWFANGKKGNPNVITFKSLLGEKYNV
ncbi:MAG: restriction endonuclease subunit M [Abditibacteriota bacterium]|nr:restriction endonuclease subunit M [Abditibacteriota bacterium]